MRLLDLLDLDAPDRLEVTESKIKGSIPVGFARNARLQPVVRFGGHMFSTGESLLKVNGVDYDVAGLDVYRKADGTWTTDSYRFARKMGTMDAPTDAAAKLIREWACTMAGRLHEANPDAFVQLGTSERNHYTDEAQYQATMTQLREDTELVGQFLAIEAGVSSGKFEVTAQLPYALHDTPLLVPGETIRWKTPGRNTLEHHRLHKAHGKVVGVILDDELLVGYAVDGSDHDYRPESYHGPILVPVELAEANDR